MQRTYVDLFKFCRPFVLRNARLFGTCRVGQFLETPRNLFVAPFRNSYKCLRKQQRTLKCPKLVCQAAQQTANRPHPAVIRDQGQAPTDVEYDAVIIGSGMGGLTTAARMAAKGAKVLVLEK